ncbi:NAD(P)-dependent oxidoreductase [Rurimicrobium arvi]|uniref:NAD(P)-dependent oxidoreductase n=1 Tax=Rurimicrobium arvi TaxID=2049916 RepID=A0ABP8MMC8_9BACT
MSGKILITGASGFVGYHLTEAAVKAGFEVFAAVRRSSVVDQLKGMPVQFVYIDFSDTESIRAQFAEHQFEYVIHAAGLTRARSTAEYNEVNAVYSRNLAIVAQEYGVKKFVFLSSLAALGPVGYQHAGAIDEKHTPAPVTDYGRSKLLAEQYLWNELPQLPLVILRPTAVYGPREKDIFIMFKTLAGGIEPYIGRVQQKLSFIYVKDLANVAIKALAVDTGRAVYNISDGQIYDRYALADIFKKTMNKRTFRIHVPLPLVKVIAATLEKFSRSTPALNKEKLNELTAESWDCSIERAKRELGFTPAYNLNIGLQETLNWYKENRWL